MLVLLKNFPTLVILGSSFWVSSGPTARALLTIPLNLIILNGKPFKPVLSWIKNIGPFESILIASATTSKNWKGNDESG